MNIWQVIFVFVFGLFAFSGFLLGLQNCTRKKNPYGLTYPFNIIGAFVWADAVIFGLFWSLVSLIVLFLSDFLLFLLALSFFWFVRALGETMYWFNQQFAVRNRNPAHTLWISKIFPGDSSWVAMQIFWQCTIVVTSISSIFLIRLFFK